MNLHSRFHLKNFGYDYLLLLFISLLGIGMMVSLCLRSEGMPVQDEIAHFNISRQAWKVPQLMLDIWGRPMNTIIYMPPAYHSWLAARLYSILLSLIILILTVLTARKMGMKNYLFLIPALLLFQPWFLKLGFTTLTEVPFCLALIAGVYFWVSEKYTLASLCFGTLPIIRHEGIALLGAWCLWMILTRRWIPFVAAISPFVLYNAIYWLVFSRPAFQIFLNLKPTTLYGSGSWFHYVTPVLKAAGVLPVLLSLLVIPLAFRLREKGLVFVLYGIYFLTHTIIYKFGLFASGGYYLFLMPLSVGFALAAALGVVSLQAVVGNYCEKFNRKWVSTAAQVTLALAVCAGMWAIGRTARPYSLSKEDRAMGKVSEYLHSQGIPPEKVYSTHAYFRYLYDLPYANWLFRPELTDLKNLDEGSIIVWDEHYSDRWKVDYEWLISSTSSFEKTQSFSNGTAIIFEKKAQP